MKIGFIGLGNVGSKLSGSLLRNGFDVSVYDLSSQLMVDFAKNGAKIGENPDDVETWTMEDEQKMQMFETGLILFFLFALENM